MKEHSDQSAKDFFRSLPAASRLERKKAYEKLLDEEHDRVIGFKGIKMPWMVESWERGLKLLNEVIEEENTNIIQQTK
jgi:hypothetical protein